MTQSAIVDSLRPDGKAVVRVFQESACGHDCENCGVCGSRRKLTVEAGNPIQAMPGDLVTVETQTGKIIRAAALVYVLPLCALLLGCILGAALSLSEGMQALLGVGGLILGSAGAVCINRFIRQDRPLEYTIIDVGGHLGSGQEQEA